MPYSKPLLPIAEDEEVPVLSFRTLRGNKLTENCNQLFKEWFCPSYYTSKELDWSILGGIGCGSILGVLARQQSTVWFAPALAPSGAMGQAGIVVSSIVPNMLGCFVMGICTALQPTLQPRHPDLYAAVATGFCGCCTTFSTYNTAVAMLFLQSPSPAEGVLYAVVTVILGACTAWSMLMFGRGMARSPPRYAEPSIAERAKCVTAKLDQLVSAPGASLEAIGAVVADLTSVAHDLQVAGPDLIRNKPEELPGKCIRLKLVLFWSLLVTFLAITIMVAISDPSNFSSLLVSVVVAPLGAWSRYFLCKRNAGFNVPVYTVGCNHIASAGSALLAFALGKSCESQLPIGVMGIIFQGISFGYFGSLSTVSTFVDEARRLGEKDSEQTFFYVAWTLLGGQAIAVLCAPAYDSADGCWLWWS